MILSFVQRSKNISLELFASTKNALIKLSEVLHGKLLGLAGKEASLADLISNARKEMTQIHHVQPEDYLIRFKTELSGNMIVRTNLIATKSSERCG